MATHGLRDSMQGVGLQQRKKRLRQVNVRLHMDATGSGSAAARLHDVTYMIVEA